MPVEYHGGRAGRSGVHRRMNAARLNVAGKTPARRLDSPEKVSGLPPAGPFREGGGGEGGSELPSLPIQLASAVPGSLPEALPRRTGLLPKSSPRYPGSPGESPAAATRPRGPGGEGPPKRKARRDRNRATPAPAPSREQEASLMYSGDRRRRCRPGLVAPAAERRVALRVYSGSDVFVPLGSLGFNVRSKINTCARGDGLSVRT